MENDLYGLKTFPCTCPIMDSWEKSICEGCKAYRKQIESELYQD